MIRHAWRRDRRVVWVARVILLVLAALLGIIVPMGFWASSHVPRPRNAQHS